jgi:hypothetical protein
MKRVLFIAAAILVVSVGVAAADTAVTVGSGWHGFVAFGPGVPSASPFTFTSTAPVLVTVTDVFCVGDRYTISDGSTTLGTTSVPLPFDCNYANFTGDPDTALADPNYSHGRFAVRAGAHSIGIVWVGQFGTGGGVYVRFDTFTTANCANGGWETITASPTFTSESDCISFVSPPAVAPRISRGDAEAVYSASGNGGQAILLHSPAPQGAPDPQGVRIGPFGAANGRHFCNLDWHVLGVNIVDFPGSHADMSALLNQLDVEITLDGAPFPLLSSTVKRWNPEAALAAFGSADAWFKPFGGLIAPGALAVGTHTTSIVLTDPSTGEVDTGSATFFVDASGTGSCA